MSTVKLSGRLLASSHFFTVNWTLVPIVRHVGTGQCSLCRLLGCFPQKICDGINSFTVSPSSGVRTVYSNGLVSATCDISGAFSRVLAIVELRQDRSS